jgi:hypothetical protein
MTPFMPKPAILASILLAAPLLASSSPAAAAPASADGERGSTQVRVVVDAKGLGEAAEFFEKEVTARVKEAVEGAGYEVVESVEAEVTVRVRMSFFNEEDLDYQVDVDISAGSELVRLETLGCAQCVDEDLLGKIEGQGGEIVAGIDKALVRVKEGGEEPSGGGDGGGEVEEVGVIGALGGVGIGVAAVGLGVTIAGAVELSRGRVYEGDPATSEARYLRWSDSRPRGQVLLGVGLGTLALGGALLVTDLVIRAKKRKRQREQASAFVPVFGAEMVGLGWVRHF